MQSPSSDANSMMQLLQRDFLYNLSLLRERDAELERYDLEVVVLREELEKRDAACHDMRRAWEEREAQEAADRPRVATLQARLADHEKRQRELREELGRKASELHGAAQELEALRAFKEEGQTTVVKAQQLAAERQQELASVRNELGLRLYAAQQELGEAEEGWRNALHEERAQLEARLKAGRTEAARQCGAMQEQAERLHAELANAKRSAEEAHDELRALRDAHPDRFRVRHCLSNASATAAADGGASGARVTRGRVDPAVLREEFGGAWRDGAPVEHFFIIGTSMMEVATLGMIREAELVDFSRIRGHPPFLLVKGPHGANSGWDALSPPASERDEECPG